MFQLRRDESEEPGGSADDGMEWWRDKRYDGVRCMLWYRMRKRFNVRVGEAERLIVSRNICGVLVP